MNQSFLLIKREAVVLNTWAVRFIVDLKIKLKSLIMAQIERWR